MTNTRNLNKYLKSVIAIVVSAMVIAAAFPVNSSAASVRKCYTISTGNTTVYSDTALTKKYGTIYGTDEITLVKAYEKYSKVTYPISGGKTKTGYIKTSAILLSTKSTSYTASEKVTTYKRPGGATYGYISKGDKVLKFGVKGNYTQVRYPVSSGYKYAFIRNADSTKAATTPTTKPTAKPTTPTQKPTVQPTSNSTTKPTSTSTQNTKSTTKPATNTTAPTTKKATTTQSKKAATKPASTASIKKCYTISTGNTPVYADAALTNQSGTIFDTDEITVTTVTDKYSKVTYPVSGGKTKTGYIKTSAILLKTTGSTYTASAAQTTYKRPGGAKYGAIAKGDKVTKLGTKGNYTQVKYPVSGGYKYAFISNGNSTKPTASKGTASKKQPSSSKSAKLTSPVPANCKFTKKTEDIDGRKWYHDINKNLKKKTPVYAIADGKVTYKQATTGGYLTSYGNFIEFKSSVGGYAAKYCHLKSFVGANQKIDSSRTRQKSGSSKVYVLKTKKVKKGEVIGYIGQTGNASGRHLHFELRKNGKRIDPTSVFPGLK